DLCFTNAPDQVHSLQVSPTTISDHNMIEMAVYGPTMPCFTGKSSEHIQPLTQLNFRKADWKTIEEEFNQIDWSDCLSPDDIDAKLANFMSVIQKICVKTVPKIQAKPTRNLIPRERRILMRRRIKISSRLSKQQCPNARSKLTKRLLDTEEELTLSHAKEREEREKKAIEMIKSNPKAFYSFAKEATALPQHVGPLIDGDGSLTADPKKMCEALRRQFENAFSSPLKDKLVEDPTMFFSVPCPKESPKIDGFTFGNDDIVEAINEIDSASAAGPDGVPACLLKNCRHAFAKPLGIIFQSSLDQGRLPKALKEGIIRPIHKGGNRATPKNYRPISLTSHVSKVMERIVRRKIISFLETEKLLPESQHGFRPNRGCLTQLLQHYDWVLKQQLAHRNVDVIYLDFAKAFDKVDHGVLCHKLLELGIGGKLGEWIHNFLQDRKQTVMIDGFFSADSHIRSGVPQGTVLGPLLFTIALYDLPLATQTSTIMTYADDTKVSQTIKNQDSIRELQMDLSKIYQWAKTNNMQLNADKFQALHYRRTNAYPSSYVGPQGENIRDADTVRDLGILLDSDGTFQTHHLKLADQCRKITGQILRTFKTRNKEAMFQLWRSLVLSRLDYCSQLWSPQTVKSIAVLESTQRRFTKAINSMKDLSYRERLRELKLYSLERRRERYSIIYIWKILQGIAPNFGIEGYTNPRTGRWCVIPRIPSLPSRTRTQYCNSLGFKGPRLFNALPQYIRDIQGDDVEVFKILLDK
ncbi:hypothetical protein Ahia01_000015400, partial [Argonauta hians]